MLQDSDVASGDYMVAELRQTRRVRGMHTSSVYGKSYILHVDHIFFTLFLILFSVFVTFFKIQIIPNSCCG
jgi:hypothetical protein